MEECRSRAPVGAASSPASSEPGPLAAAAAYHDVMSARAELRAIFVVAMALSVSPLASACSRRVCEDPKPVVDALRPPLRSTLFSRSEPPPLNGSCSQRYSRNYASNATEEQSLADVSAQLVAQGFARVEPTYESPWWCDRKGRFVQLRRGELLARVIVHPTPTSQCGRNPLSAANAGSCVSVTVRNDALRSPGAAACR